MYLYCIFDKVLGEYAAPVMASNDKVAKRWFNNAVSKSDYDAADFQLYKVGSFNVKTGGIIPCFDYVMNGLDLVDPDVLEEK